MRFRSMRLATVILAPVALFSVVESVRAQDCVEPDCVPTPACESDDDCADGMSCETRSMLECPAELDRSCMDGESDDECASRSQMLEEESCTTIEDHLCVPDWSIPCNTDADCPQEFMCTGQGGTPCEPIDKTCAVDTDCPSGWLCETYDAGYCTEGDGCIGNQIQETGCVPPQLQGDADSSGVAGAGATTSSGSSDDTETRASSGHGDDPAASTSSGCSVSKWIGTSSNGGLLFALLAVTWTARRRRRA